MPYFLMFLGSIFPFLSGLVTATVGRVAVALGFGTVTFMGVGLIFDKILDKLNAATTTLPPLVATFIHLCGIDTAINIMMSTGFALLVLKGANRAGNSRQMVWRKPGDKSDVDWGA